MSHRARVVTWWWVALAAFVIFVVLPGPAQSPFSGVPLSSRALILFFSLVILGVFTAMYPPVRGVRGRWLIVLLLLVAAKIALAPMLVETGWRGEYWTSADWKRDGSLLRQADFVTQHRLRRYRIDAGINFDRVNFGLDFLNDPAPRTAEVTPEGRDVQFPMRVRWHGWVGDANPLDLKVTARGRLQVVADGRLLWAGSDPADQPVHIDALHADAPAAAHEITVDYVKPNGVSPAVAVAGIDAVVVQERADLLRLRGSTWAARLITILGVLGLVVLFIAFTDAYPRMSVLALEHIWSTPTKVASCIFFALFIAWGVRQTVPLRHATMLEGFGDDPHAYESQARHIVRTGLLMTEPGKPAEPYYFYPLYSYVLAGAHIVVGEDHASVVMLNYFCLAWVGIFCASLLGNRVSSGAGVAVLVALALFLSRFALLYTASAYTDNLYLPIVLAVVAAAVAALERRSFPLLLLTGTLTALGAATRPSFLLFLPFFGLWLLVDRGVGTLWARLRAACTFAGGFAAGVAPFTLRNWIVSKRFVLLVASYAMIPFFLYPPGASMPQLLIDTPDGYGRPPNLIESVHQILDVWRTSPLRTAWTEVRKVLFTIGLTGFGPSGIDVPFGLLLFPLLFGIALWSGRMPRNVRNVVIVFGLSHIAALVIAAPWTYGYKTILPLHMLFLVSAAFILPNWGEQREGAPSAERAERPPRRRTVSVVLPTFNEKDSIASVVRGFLDTGVVDEVLVVNNNAVEGTSEAIADTAAREIFETRQGYGAAIQRGMREANCDLIVICEPDGTFLPEDIHKLLSYADDFDVVYGSRTSHGLVWRGANMGLFLRWGNWAVAKYLEFMYNTSSLTDVGCTYRLITREAAAALHGQFRIPGSQFGPEMMIVTLRAGYRAIQIPLNYRPRVGVSAVTGDPAKAFLLGLQMIWLITSRRFEDLVLTAPQQPLHADAREAEPL